MELDDGCQTIFLSTRGQNRAEVPESLVKFLEFVKADLRESEGNYGDSYIESIQTSIRRIKRSREMGERFMIFEEMMQDERNQGREEGRMEGKKESLLEVLQAKGIASEEMKEKIRNIDDGEVLNRLFKKALEAGTPEDFLAGIKEVSFF